MTYCFELAVRDAFFHIPRKEVTALSPKLSGGHFSFVHTALLYIPEQPNARELFNQSANPVI